MNAVKEAQAERNAVNESKEAAMNNLYAEAAAVHASEYEGKMSLAKELTNALGIALKYNETMAQAGAVDAQEGDTVAKSEQKSELYKRSDAYAQQYGEAMTTITNMLAVSKGAGVDVSGIMSALQVLQENGLGVDGSGAILRYNEMKAAQDGTTETAQETSVQMKHEQETAQFEQVGSEANNLYGEEMDQKVLMDAQKQLNDIGMDYGVSVADAVNVAMKSAKGSELRNALDAYANGDKNVVNLQRFMREAVREMEKKNIRDLMGTFFPNLGDEHFETVLNRTIERRIQLSTVPKQNVSLDPYSSMRANGMSGKEIAMQNAETNRREGDSDRLYREYSPDQQLSESQERSLEIVNALADKFGVNIHVLSSMGNRNGLYSKGDVYVSLDAEAGAVEYVTAHELTHSLKENAGTAYKDLCDIVVEELKNSGVDVDQKVREITDAYAKSGVKLTPEQALDEVVANSVPSILTNDAVLDRIVEKNPSLLEKIKDFFKDLVETIKGHGKELEKLKAWSQIGNLSQNEASLEAIYNKLDEITSSAEYILKLDESNANKLVPGNYSVVENENGEVVALSDENGNAVLSLKNYDEGRQKLVEYLESTDMTQEERDAFTASLDEMYEMCNKFKDKYAPFSKWSDAEIITDENGNPVFSVVTPNGDYNMNIDFSLVCRKRRTLDAVFAEMTNRGIIENFELGPKSIVKINEMIRKHGFETACALCFVDSKRFRQAKVTDTFVKLYNDMVLSLVPKDQRKNAFNFYNYGGNQNVKTVENGVETRGDEQLDWSNIDRVMASKGEKTVDYRVAKYLKEHPEARKLLLRGDFMSSRSFSEVKIDNEALMKLYNSKKGTGGPKAAFGDTQYMSDIMKNKSWTPETAYKVGGVRVQSFSDYMPRMVFDYIQMVHDMAAKKLPAHAYTKEKQFVLQFGLTGMKINMSLIPAVVEGGIAPGLDANGNYVWAGESFSYDDAVEIQSKEGYTENCGTIAVGVSKEHILKLLKDPNIRMVIPYHKSSLSPIVAHMNGINTFKDATKIQNTLGPDGKRVSKDFGFNESLHRTGNVQETVNEYLAWCEENNYTPKFNEYRELDPENYYKLLIDFTVFDENGNFVGQREVKPVFPTKENAFGSMEDLVKDSLQEDAVIEGKRDKEVKQIVDEIDATLPRTEKEIKKERVEQATGDVEKWSEGQLSLKQQEAEQQWTEDNDKAVAQLEKAFGVKINVVSGKSAVAGSMNQNDGSITINKDESLAIGVNHVLAHELTHRTEASGLYEGIAKALVKAYYDYDLEGTPDQWKNLDINSIENEELRNYLNAKYAEYKGGEGVGNLRSVDGSTAWREVIAELAGTAFDDPYMFKNIVTEKPSLGRRLLNWFARTLSDLGITSPYAKYVLDAGNMIRDALLEQQENGYNGDNDSYLGEGETYFNTLDTEMSVEEWDSMFASFVEGNNQFDGMFSLKSEYTSQENPALTIRREKGVDYAEEIFNNLKTEDGKTTGNKTIETRFYDILPEMIGKWIPVVRTNGKGGASNNAVLGYVKFSGSKYYADEEAFRADYDKHLVPNTSEFNVNGKQGKYGWIIEDVKKLDEPVVVGANKPGRYLFEDVSGSVENINDQDNDVSFSLRDTPLANADTSEPVDGWEVFSDQDIAQFRSMVNDPQNRNKKAFQKSKNGKYIIAIGNKLVYTNARFNTPSIYGVVMFSSNDGTEIDSATRAVYDYEKGECTHEQSWRILRNLFG